MGGRSMRLLVAVGVLVGCGGGEVGPLPVVPPGAPPGSVPSLPSGMTPGPLHIPADEVVRRLSELLFAAPPDADQLAAAATLPLTDSEQVAALARSMLRDPR